MKKSATGSGDLDTPTSELPPPSCSASHIKSLTNLSGSPASQSITSPISESASPQSSHGEINSKSASNLTNLGTAGADNPVVPKGENSYETASGEPLCLTTSEIKTEVHDNDDRENSGFSERTAPTQERCEMPIHPIVSELLKCDPPVRLTNHVPIEVETEESLMTSFVKLADTELVDVITWAKSVPGMAICFCFERNLLVSVNIYLKVVV